MGQVTLTKEQVYGSILGFIVGDALGVPVEFKEREWLMKNPVTDMIGFGTYNLPPGSWSDDSSLTFCLIDSLIHNYSNTDLSQRMIRWLKKGEWTPYGEAFDIGRTTEFAIRQLEQGVSPFKSGGKGEHDNGNGALMRILPLIFYLKGVPMEKRMEVANEVSQITHAHPRSLIANNIYIELAILLLENKDKYDAYEEMKQIILHLYTNTSFEVELKHFERILKQDIHTFKLNDIRSTGYVVDTLEAVIWLFLNENSYNSTVLRAVNLGDDTDTIAAITGGLAGLYYGHESINKNWINQLARKEDIFDLIERFFLKLEIPSVKK